MTRIIAGFAGSIALTVPSSGTRPTSDRVREAIFSALQARDAVAGARVLDLYAGSGAFGLEAASRGAAHVTLVDHQIRAAKANAARIVAQAPRGAAPTVITSAQTVQSFLAGAPGDWDLVFLDPPYELSNGELETALTTLVPLLCPEAIVIVERGSRTPEPGWPAGLELDRLKTYGDTVLYWLSRA